MSTDPKDHEPAPGLEDGEGALMSDEAASDIVTVMQATIAAAVGAARKPGIALTGLRLALNALREAIVTDTALNADDAKVAEDVADSLFTAESKTAAVEIARREIISRCVHSRASEEELQSVIQEGVTCLDGIVQRGQDHPVTQLVILYAARQMAFAVLKHQYPDELEYEDMCAAARGMESAIHPKRIEVRDVQGIAHMSKGGDA